ncbi:hypothetical protein Nmel_003532 [Mimus melanotis]
MKCKIRPRLWRTLSSPRTKTKLKFCLEILTSCTATRTTSGIKPFNDFKGSLNPKGCNLISRRAHQPDPLS